MKQHLFACLLASVLLLGGCQSDSGDPAPGSGATQHAVPEALSAFEPVLGLSLEGAKAWLSENPTAGPKSPEVFVDTLRATAIDGESQIVSSDYREDRLNVVLEGGLITALEGVH